MRLFLLLMALHGAAFADPPLSSAERVERARAHFEMGRAHFNLGEYEAAVRDFEEGYRLKPQPLFLYNIANSARRAGQTKKALDMFRRYLSEQPNAVEKREVQQRITELEQQLANAPPPPPSPSPEPPPIAPEPVAPEPVAPPPIAPEPVAPPPPSPEPLVVPPQSLVVVPPPPHRHSWRRDWLGATLSAVGGAALIVGAVEIGVHWPAYDRWSSASSFAASNAAYPGARDAVPHLDAGVWLMPIGAVIVLAGGIRYAVLARRGR